MLSIIISSYQAHYLINVKKNIAETIGDDFNYEIISIDNKGVYSLCQAYNIGATKAKYENLLFIHEDILFETKNWGTVLLAILNLDNCGVVGVAGGNYYGFVPASWWNTKTKFLHFKQVNNDHITFNNRVNFTKDNEEAKAIDGVFLACKKKVYNEIKFDERIKGYHGYDLIFSLQVAKKYQNYVTSKILIQHLSPGNLTKDWFVSILTVRKLIGFDKTSIIDKETELNNFYKLIFYLKNYNYSRKEIINILLTYLNISVLGTINTFKIVNRLRFLR